MAAPTRDALLVNSQDTGAAFDRSPYAIGIAGSGTRPVRTPSLTVAMCVRSEWSEGPAPGADSP